MSSTTWIAKFATRCTGVVKLMADGKARTVAEIGGHFKQSRQQMSQTVNALRDLRVLKVVGSVRVTTYDRQGRVKSHSAHQTWELCGEVDAMLERIEDRRREFLAKYESARKLPKKEKPEVVVKGERTVLPDGGVLTVHGNVRRFELGNSRRRIANDTIGCARGRSLTGCAAAMAADS